VQRKERIVAAQHPATFTLITGGNSGIGLELARLAAAAQISPANYMATTKVTPAEVASYGYQMMKLGKPVAVHTLRYKFLTSFGVRITPRFALRRLLYRMNTQGTPPPRTTARPTGQTTTGPGHGEPGRSRRR
jgi:hypothetical protein